MDVSKDRLDEAVLRIFVDLGANDGSQLLLDDLRLEWTKMRLLNDDLMDGIRRLVFSGWLDLTHTDEGPALKLSPRGRQRAAALNPGVRSLWNQVVAAAFTALPRRHAPLRRDLNGRLMTTSG